MQTEMFGLYALTGKATAFIGPALFGFATDLYESQRAGMATVLAFFVVGGAILWFVKEPARR
jgi:UMF1 family MFS transporter